MSTKFEQLLDLIVNEEMDKANELFHEIVVEKSRDIYENLIAEEEEELPPEDDVEESADEEADESVDLEDSYSMETDDEADAGPMGGDAADKFGADVGDDSMDMDGEEGPESQEDSAMFDIKNAIAELEAAFADLESAQGGDEFDADDEDDIGGDDMGGDDMGGDDMMGKPAFESRRVTREYVEKVGNDWDKNSQKAQGASVGSGSGDKDSAPVEGRSPVSSGSGKPTSGANAKNLAQGHTEGGSPTGTSPAGKAGGFLSAAKDMNTGNGNVPGGKMGVKNLAKVAGGHGAEKKGAAPGPVGSGSGDKAGQTSMSKTPTFLKKL